MTQYFCCAGKGMRSETLKSLVERLRVRDRETFDRPDTWKPENFGLTEDADGPGLTEAWR